MKKLALSIAAFLLVTMLAAPVAAAAAAEGDTAAADPIISPTEPSDPRDQLPDPNDPDSPDVITIFDGDVPLTFVKVWDPEIGEFVYIPEDEVPLGDMTSPQTGDEGSGLMGLAVIAAAAGAAVLLKPAKEDGAAC